LTFLLYLVISTEGCERERVQGCIGNYVRELDAFPSDSSHCHRLKDVLNCFWHNFSACTGPTINRWRGWVLQVASLEKFLGICQMDDASLQRMYNLLPEDSRISRYYNIMQNTDIATVDQECARRVHRMCSERFVEAVKSNKNICLDGEEWLKCYKVDSCNQESLIFRYTKYVGELIPDLVSDCSSR